MILLPTEGGHANSADRKSFGLNLVYLQHSSFWGPCAWFTVGDYSPLCEHLKSREKKFLGLLVALRFKSKARANQIAVGCFRCRSLIRKS